MNKRPDVYKKNYGINVDFTLVNFTKVLSYNVSIFNFPSGCLHQDDDETTRYVHRSFGN